MVSWKLFSSRSSVSTKQKTNLSLHLSVDWIDIPDKSIQTLFKKALLYLETLENGYDLNISPFQPTSVLTEKNTSF